MTLKSLALKYMEHIEGDFSNRTLARQIVRENPKVFPSQNSRDIESMRSVIRVIRGAHGKKHMRQSIPKYIRSEKKPSEYMRGFMKKGDEPPERVWKMPEEIKRPLIIGDLHIPHHHLPAIEVSLDYALDKGIDAIYINGDLVDFYKISNWNKDPKHRDIQEEIDLTVSFLEGLVGFGLPIYWKMGNHEDRWNRYLIQNAPELHDIDSLMIENVFELDSLGIELIESRSRALFGHLNVIHGHEFGQSFFNPVNPARGLFLRAKTSTLAGHNHQTSAHHENNLNGKATACFSIGCLCNLSPEYRPFAGTKWNHGFAIVDLDGDFFHVQNHRIIEGKVV